MEHTSHILEVVKDIQLYKTSWVVEADIKGFFDHVSHEWLVKMLEHDIADKKFISIIEKFLEAGIMDNGIYNDTIEGAPQGNGASPMLANIFLHYVLDNWFEAVVRKHSNGECYIVRYADDFICCFQYPNDAEWLFKKINEKLRGHYQYYGVTDNIVECKRFLRQTNWYLYKYLNRRSQKRSYNHDTFFNGLLKTFPVVDPRIRVSLAYR